VRQLKAFENKRDFAPRGGPAEELIWPKMDRNRRKGGESGGNRGAGPALFARPKPRCRRARFCLFDKKSRPRLAAKAPAVARLATGHALVDPVIAVFMRLLRM
jgi:hypothetical protein